MWAQADQEGAWLKCQVIQNEKLGKKTFELEKFRGVGAERNRDGRTGLWNRHLLREPRVANTHFCMLVGTAVSHLS